MFEGQPKGLYALSLANTGERFGYYTMLAVFVLFLQDNFGWDAGVAGAVYSGFLAFVYFLPLFGGMLADKIGYNKCVTTGILVMFLGYALLSIPAGNGLLAMTLMFAALVMVCLGTSLFKGNLQVMVGDLYNAPEMQSKRDSAFSIFYMAINIGALFAPTAAVRIMDYAQHTLGVSKADSYHYAFGVACISLIVSIAIYYAARSTYQQVAAQPTAASSSDEVSKTTESTEPELSKSEVKERVVALCLVFAVVIFFWMAFHQNGATMTLFARDYTASTVEGATRIGFNIFSLFLIAVSVYTLFGAFQSETNKAKTFCGICTAALWLGAYAVYAGMPAKVNILPSDFQQFNPFFVVALTPVSLAIFGALAKKGKEPSAPRKIGLGMIVAAVGFSILTFASLNLASPKSLNGTVSPDLISPEWLISTYLVLTFAELLLSPMGISFVSKVAPPKYKGAMMGCWFAATALGNYLVSIPGLLWNKVELWGVWGLLIVLCLLSALFIFSIMKKLESATEC